MVLDTWLGTALGLTPKRLATPALSRPHGQQPRDLGLAFGELARVKRRTGSPVRDPSRVVHDADGFEASELLKPPTTGSSGW
jgi:hypothetical protein